MEDRRLNINRPLLSVRRFSSIPASQKNDNRENTSYLPVRPLIESSNTESTSDLMMSSGSVPFGWEHSPGRAKNKQTQAKENTPSLPKLPPGRFLKPIKKDLGNISQDSNVPKMSRFERSKSVKKEGSVSLNDDNEDDDNEAYMDALDTLSRAETSFYNCSASGVSGHGSDAKPSGILKADPRMRDFMMGRFLPAAKAMASDVPHHKKNVAREKPREVKTLVNVGNNKQQLRYGPNFLQDVGYDNEEEEDVDSDDDYNEHGNSSSKFCGLFPRFCSATPVHGMCTRTRLPVSPANRTHASSSSSSSFRETENEPARNAVYKHRSLHNVWKHDSSEIANMEGSKLYTRLQGRGISINLNKALQSSISERSGSSSKKKGISFKELLADKNTSETETDGQDSMIEKTLYVVDVVHVAKSPKEKPPSSSKKPQTDTSGVSKKSCDSKHDLKSSSKFSCDSKQDLKSKKHTAFWDDSEVDFDTHEYTSCDKKLKGCEKRDPERPAPPPLPKTPSDSWLSRALPSVSSRSAPLRWNPSSNTFADDQKSDDQNIQDN